MRNFIKSLDAAYNRTRVSRWDTEWIAVGIGAIGGVVVHWSQVVAQGVLA